MSVRVLRAPEGDPNPQARRMKRRDGEDNAAWLGRALKSEWVKTGRNWSLLLLLGGTDPLSFRLRVAQSHIRHDLSPSQWSHVAFVSERASAPADWKTIEVSLAPAGPFGDHGFAPPSNGIQDGRVASCLSPGLFPNIGILSVPVSSAAVRKTLDGLGKRRNVLDVPQLILRWLSFCWGAGTPANPLLEGIGIPSAAVLEVAFAEHQLDLTPGLESRSSCPEAIWQAAKWWYPYYERASKRAMCGVFSDEHRLVPDDLCGGSPASLTVPEPRARRPRRRQRRR